jgi:hypothetical protein
VTRSGSRVAADSGLGQRSGFGLRKLRGQEEHSKVQAAGRDVNRVTNHQHIMDPFCHTIDGLL